MYAASTHHKQACAACLAEVDLRDAAQKANGHTRTHVDGETGAEVRIVWCPACIGDDVLSQLLADDALPDDHPEAGATVWSLHERLHARAIELARAERWRIREMVTAYAGSVADLHMAAGPALDSDGNHVEDFSVLRAVLHVRKDCTLRAHTFRGPGRLWGLPAQVGPGVAPRRRRR